MSARFTSGPWSAIGNTIYSLFFARGHERNKWDCTIYGDVDCPREEQQAVAHLIAVAPDMYEVLEAIEIALDKFHASPSDVLDEKAPIMNALRDALRKARGEA